MIRWKEYRVKDVAKKIGSGATPNSNNDKYYDNGIFHWINTGDFNNSDIYFGKQMITEQALNEVSALRFYPVDTVLVAMYGASIGKIGLLKVKATVNQACCAIVPDRRLCLPRYLFYVLMNNKDSFLQKSFGGTQPNISQTIVSNLVLYIPSLSLQQRIVDYLDEKLAKIDGWIEVLEKQQRAYARLKKSVIHQAVTRGLNPNVPLKDSGIEWIGMIPEHWKRCRLKDIGYMYSGLTGKSGDDFRCDDETKTKPYVPFTNVLNNTVVDNDNFHYVVMGESEQQNQVRTNDLLFLMSSEDYESIAKSAVVVGNPGEVYLNSFCRGLRIIDRNCYAPFINYQLNSEMYRDALRFEARGFTRINIKIDRVSCHLVSLPPLSEQQAIANYLDEKCAKIDAAIENIGKQINASKRLKRALINEVITGQRAV